MLKLNWLWVGYNRTCQHFLYEPLLLQMFVMFYENERIPLRHAAFLQIISWNLSFPKKLTELNTFTLICKSIIF